MRYLLSILPAAALLLGGCANLHAATPPPAPGATAQARLQVLMPKTWQQRTENNPLAAAQSRPQTFVIRRAKLENPTTLKLEYDAGYAPCYGKLGRVEVKQSATQVIVTLYRSYPEPPDPHRICPQYRLRAWTTVTLDTPLDGRSLIDGATGKPISMH